MVALGVSILTHSLFVLLGIDLKVVLAERLASIQNIPLRRG
jgi:cytochrome bd-type quinol oxidase subunit 1